MNRLPHNHPDPPVNYVLLDGENVSEVDLSLFGDKTIHFILLYGARKSKLKVDLVEKLFEQTASVKLIRLTSSGKNALDFALAYYLGQAAAADPTAHFQIVSKDTGYDPLINHLRSRQISVRRHADCSTLHVAATRPAVKAAKKLPVKASAARSEPFQKIVEHLRKIVASRPKTKKRLFGTMKNYLGKDAAEDAKEKLCKELKEAGHIAVDEKGAITYHFPET